SEGPPGGIRGLAGRAREIGERRMSRRSIAISSFSHANPIPAASRVGPLLVSSIIAPRNPGEDTMPKEIDAQLDNLFHHVGEMLAAAGGNWGDVAKMTFYAADGSAREAINRPWLEHFPDPASRPARHTQVVPGSGRFLTCDFLAYIED